MEKLKMSLADYVAGYIGTVDLSELQKQIPALNFNAPMGKQTLSELLKVAEFLQMGLSELVGLIDFDLLNN